ncbi:MAG: peptidyl-prolyl cis-trans isomerase [Gammaproteobacteria bacterium]|jgi:hypothetical protein|nr:peptidyl-prolyl cis-trans isomerase [Gammaproteobacteria bacterium]MBK6585327.1 peptidyl-prolyl cis-trans isomerase [Gammaproteobacteria bacterium]MBK7521797.1 peptidyl-prolyl cis-trans isomerase [Gammaproteobacteria bacterium]MBK9666504.1 peptidyl-prolyl cis-trans isomerase [Gammaproteobacteria bacterium]
MLSGIRIQGKGLPILKVFRDPLLHFLLLGGALFLLYFSLNDAPIESNPASIVVDEARMRVIAEQFGRVWMRQPTREEMQQLVEDHVKEEILYREGVALGLDKDDLVIRRRLRQKLEFLYSDLSEVAPASDAQMQAYLDLHQDRYRQPATISFSQVFIRTDDASHDPRARADHLLAILNDPQASHDELADAGDTGLLPRQMANESLAGVTRLFGEKLAQQITAAPIARWSGPYVSDYGLHLVQVSEFQPGRVSTLAEVRASVERDLGAERSAEANNRFYQALRKRYDVRYTIP